MGCNSSRLASLDQILTRRSSGGIAIPRVYVNDVRPSPPSRTCLLSKNTAWDAFVVVSCVLRWSRYCRDRCAFNRYGGASDRSASPRWDRHHQERCIERNVRESDYGDDAVRRRVRDDYGRQPSEAAWLRDCEVRCIVGACGTPPCVGRP